MLYKKISLRGRLVTMKGMDREDFEDIIAWRNDPENTKYLNQPYILTLELQQKCYEEKYLQSDDILFVFVDNCSGKRIGTLGVNDIDYDHRVAIAGRLLIGEREYRGSPELLEGNLVFYDFLFNILGFNDVYCHIVKENKKAFALDKRLGFQENTQTPRYPHYCHVNGMDQVELINTRESFERCKEKLRPMLEHFLKQSLDKSETI